MSENVDSNHINQSKSSPEESLEDLECLNFPGDVDWSSTLVLRCDPSAGPYNLSDVTAGLFNIVRRIDVFNLGATSLNHAFTMSFKTTYGLENFVKYLKNPKLCKGVMVKGHRCTFTRVPNKCVTVIVRWIPLEIDTAHITEIFNKYGAIVKTELLRSKFRGWFNVYTNERKITLCLRPGVTPQDLPYGIVVKELIGAVFVEERNPKCLECYYTGHKNDSCEHEQCAFNQIKK
ncbi:uncharacterized protein LOC118184898 [Stegodyphus dumicola]|uniref:uncharacterized protein LOC118184898 n=1 Tax=Stegodyphus dumicola TaxID=202533 RepID=UPI0015AF395B|nr:uncharacterized protein LOC118184898 [Stegodyphus dumicola]